MSGACSQERPARGTVRVRDWGMVRVRVKHVGRPDYEGLPAEVPLLRQLVGLGACHSGAPWKGGVGLGAAAGIGDRDLELVS